MGFQEWDRILGSDSIVLREASMRESWRGWSCIADGLARNHSPQELEAKPKLAIHVGKIITSAGKPIVGGTILVSDGKIEALGKTREIGFRKVIR